VYNVVPQQKLKLFHEHFVTLNSQPAQVTPHNIRPMEGYCYASGSFTFVECDDMIKLVSVPLLYGTLICGMTGMASAQSVPFYPTSRTDYAVGIPGTYDHVGASGSPEYNLNTEQQPGTAPAAMKTGQHGCGSRCSYPDFGSIAKTAPAGG
jgi:hypothetical protein